MIRRPALANFSRQRAKSSLKPHDITKIGNRAFYVRYKKDAEHLASAGKSTDRACERVLERVHYTH